MKKSLAVVLALVFVLSMAAPVFGVWDDPPYRGQEQLDDWYWTKQHGKQGSMDYNFDIKFDGTVEWERQIGHLCNTGAEWKMHAAGEGEMEATGSTKMVPWKLTAETEMDWVTAPDAVENLVVTSVIELCAPPKKTFTTTDIVYNDRLGVWESKAGPSGEYLPRYYYNYEDPTNWERPPSRFFSGRDIWNLAARDLLSDERGESTWSPEPNIALDMSDELDGAAFYDQDFFLTDAAPPAVRWDMAPNVHSGGWNRWGGAYLGELQFDGIEGWENLRDFYGYGHMNIQDGLGQLGENYSTINVTDLTEQIWAVQVEANPGMSGNLHQDFEAAYGPHESQLENLGGAADETVHKDAWRYYFDSDGYLEVDRGVDYVGNYFEIDQMARTSDGIVKRYIDISSPWSGAYHYEDFEVEGMVEVEEDFEMMNIGEGEAATPDWWDLFQ